MAHGRPIDVRLNADPVALKSLTRSKIVFRVGVGSCLLSLICIQGVLCVAVSYSILLNISKMYTWCWSVQSMWIT